MSDHKAFIDHEGYQIAPSMFHNGWYLISTTTTSPTTGCYLPTNWHFQHPLRNADAGGE